MNLRVSILAVFLLLGIGGCASFEDTCRDVAAKSIGPEARDAYVRQCVQDAEMRATKYRNSTSGRRY